jgi:hypothetical protein
MKMNFFAILDKAEKYKRLKPGGGHVYDFSNV